MSGVAVGRRTWRMVPPAALTLGCAVCGFLAILAALESRTVGVALPAAGLLVAVAWLLDAADGPIARALGSQSELGKQLDTLADFAAFGCAPAALIAAFGAARPSPWLSLGAAVLYFAAALVRLARFNASARGDAPEGHLYFRGLPSPVAALLVAALASGGSVLPGIFPLRFELPPWAIACAASAAAVLMLLESVPFGDLPKLVMKRRVTPAPLIATAVGVVSVGFGATISALVALYIVYYVVKRIMKAGGRVAS